MRKILFFGIYDPLYARNRVLMRGFRELGFEVLECRISTEEFGFIARMLRLWRMARRMNKAETPDIVIVAYPGHSVVWLARLAFGRRFVFDAFVSLYDSNVSDREVYGRADPRAWRDWIYDWLGFRLPETVLLDTDAQISYAADAYGADRKKMIRVLVGSDDEIFHPLSTAPTRKETRGIKIHFHGTFIPLQGAKYIIEAANLLRDHDVDFTIVGRGQTFHAVQDRARSLVLENVAFLEQVPLDRLPELIAEADVCLGIFGDTDKALRVIPNKVYEYAAMGKPIITADSTAIKEVFSDGKDVILCARADAESMADAIASLAADPDLRVRLGAAALATYREKCTPQTIVAGLLSRITHD